MLDGSDENATAPTHATRWIAVCASRALKRAASRTRAVRAGDVELALWRDAEGIVYALEGTATATAHARPRTYPVVERHGLVFVCTADGAPPDAPSADDAPAHATLWSRLHAFAAALLR